jgi:ribosomal protein S18 acetylase RimI-like enzyme
VAGSNINKNNASRGFRTEMYLRSMNITKANENDIPGLVKLLNSAYRGDESKKGWTTEADMISGELRTDEANMKELMGKSTAVFLKYTNEQNEIEGCVYLDQQDGKIYLGMLSVVPELQTKGIGKQLMTASEKYAKEQDCAAIFMRVISIRSELIAWYERRGYYKTGKTETFEDSPFGSATIPFEFIVMQKDLL